MFRLANDEILDAVTLAEFIEQHRILKDHRYVPLMAAYRTNYPIFTQPPKPEFKPDKRIAVNFAKYIVDTMNGFFIGMPAKVMSSDEVVF